MGKTITGSSTIGVTLSVNPTTIAGTVATTFTAAVYGTAAKTWTLANDGTIDSSEATGVYLEGIGKVTNAKHSFIGGYNAGIGIRGNSSISNAGTIAGNIAGIEVAEDGASANITNSAGGVITGKIGIEAGGSPYYSVPGGKGTATILNQGLISGQTGIYALAGTIDNAKGGTIAGHYGAAVALLGAGTIIDAGLIESTSHYGYAIRMGRSAGNELLLQSGATLIGAINEFAAGQTIDEAGVKITAESFAGGVLTLFDGKSTFGTLQIDGYLNAGAFDLKSDGHGGTDIVLGAETFTGTYATGLTLAALDNVIASDARITGPYFAINASAYRPWTLTNQGTLISPDDSVILAGGGFLSNAAHGLIEGGTGVDLLGATLVDAGTIIGTSGVALYLAPVTSSNDIVLQKGGKLEGAIIGFIAGDTIDLAGVTATGETFHDGILTLTNGHAVEATIVLDGLFKTASFNLKSVSGGTDIVTAPTETFTGHYGVALRVSSQFTSISPTGSFGGESHGVYAEGGPGVTLLNSGTISSLSDGVNFAGGQVTNAAGGLISGGYSGVVTEGKLINAGSISGGKLGIALYSTGAVGGNLAGGRIYGSYASATLYDGSFANAGTMSGPHLGVNLANATFSNTGRVIGGSGNYDAYGLSGLYEYRADGLASNAASGIIEGATGARVAGGVLVNAGHIIGNNNFGGIANARGLVVTGGVVTNTATGTISGNYGVKLAQGTLIDAGLITATGAAIAFGTLAATLVLDKGNVIDGAISGFIAGDVIDFAGTTIKSETFSNGILTLKDGASIIETLALSGDYDTTDFRLISLSSGTELTLAGSVASLASMQFLRPGPSPDATSLTIPTLAHAIPAASATPAATPTPTIMGWLQSHPTTPPPLVPAVTLNSA